MTNAKTPFKDFWVQFYKLMRAHSVDKILLLSVPTSSFVRIIFFLIYATKICQKIADNCLNCFHLFKETLSARNFLRLWLLCHVAVFLPWRTPLSTMLTKFYKLWTPSKIISNLLMKLKTMTYSISWHTCFLHRWRFLNICLL